MIRIVADGVRRAWGNANSLKSVRLNISCSFGTDMAIAIRLKFWSTHYKMSYVYIHIVGMCALSLLRLGQAPQEQIENTQHQDVELIDFQIGYVVLE